ncbi:MAG: aspartate aminotransferase family protein [Xanthomonadales bacterium]|jgi:acetylornithine aminotransferase|nr:aspartate aminotransferase family protein [Xanthomonadales bacterium]
MSDHLMNTYVPLPVAFARGEGAWLWDENGRRYLDAISGLGVCSLGHAHPQVADVIADQAKKLLHSGNLVRIPWQEQLAERLADVTALEKAFICNSGTEAIECALKITRIAGHRKGLDMPGVIVMEHSFHGRTLAALSATGSRKAQAGFEPLVGGFIRAPFGDLEAIATIAKRRQDIAAILVEPIQGESGIRVPPPGYLAALRKICDEFGWLLIFDEIQCGLCRTGKWYAHQHESVLPDILTTAKALANGLPVGACVARGVAAEAFAPGQHGSTFGGNPLVSRTACTVLDVMRAENLAERADQTGSEMLERFRQRLSANAVVREVRGRGLMIGIELTLDANHLKLAALERGLLLNVTQDRVIRLLPPLIIDAEQAEEIVEVVCSLVEQTA